ncbi:MAG: ComF family protein [Armatimonadota bacterium]
MSSNKIISNVFGLWGGFLDLIYPPHCLVCGKIGCDYFCEICKEKIHLIEPPTCTRCGSPIEEYCRMCVPNQFEFNTAYCCAAYEGVMRDAIHIMKYNFQKVMCKPLGEIFADYAEDKSFDCDIIIPIPIHKKRYVERGFNQAELLARYVSRRIGIELETKILIKHKNTLHQTNLSKEEREANVKDCFSIKSNINLSGKHILLVDDVFTTGNTLNSASITLKTAGVKKITALCLARSV